MGLVSEPPAGGGRGQGSGCAAGPGELQGKGDLMWAFLGKGLLQTEGDLRSRGLEERVWAKPGAGGGEKLERQLGPSWRGSWGQATKGIG